MKFIQFCSLITLSILSKTFRSVKLNNRSGIETGLLLIKLYFCFRPTFRFILPYSGRLAILNWFTAATLWRTYVTVWLAKSMTKNYRTFLRPCLTFKAEFTHNNTSVCKRLRGLQNKPPDNAWNTDSNHWRPLNRVFYWWWDKRIEKFENCFNGKRFSKRAILAKLYCLTSHHVCTHACRRCRASFRIL